MPEYAVIASGTNVSAGFALGRTDRGVSIQVPSLTAASDVRVGMSPTSGGPYSFVLQRADGTGMPYTVHSGVGPAVGRVFLPMPYGRITTTGSTTGPTTFTLYA